MKPRRVRQITVLWNDPAFGPATGKVIAPWPYAAFFRPQFQATSARCPQHWLRNC